MEQLKSLKEWLHNPVTEHLFSLLDDERQRHEDIILAGNAPSMFSEQFLLREQNIGEARGVCRIAVLSSQLIEALTPKDEPEQE